MGGGKRRRRVVEERETRMTGVKTSTLLSARVSDGKDHGDQTGANRTTKCETTGSSRENFKTVSDGSHRPWP